MAFEINGQNERDGPAVNDTWDRPSALHNWGYSPFDSKMSAKHLSSIHDSVFIIFIFYFRTLKGKTDTQVCIEDATVLTLYRINTLTLL